MLDNANCKYINKILEPGFDMSGKEKDRTRWKDDSDDLADSRASQKRPTSPLSLQKVSKRAKVEKFKKYN